MVWNSIIQALINTVLVLMVCQLIKVYKPIITEKLGWFLPLISMMIGPLIMMLQKVISDLVGLPCDLSPIIAAWTGAAAVGAHQFYHQIDKGRPPTAEDLH